MARLVLTASLDGVCLAGRIGAPFALDDGFAPGCLPPGHTCVGADAWSYTVRIPRPTVDDNGTASLLTATVSVVSYGDVLFKTSASATISDWFTHATRTGEYPITHTTSRSYREDVAAFLRHVTLRGNPSPRFYGESHTASHVDSHASQHSWDRVGRAAPAGSVMRPSRTDASTLELMMTQATLAAIVQQCVEARDALLQTRSTTK